MVFAYGIDIFVFSGRSNQRLETSFDRCLVRLTKTTARCMRKNKERIDERKEKGERRKEKGERRPRMDDI